MSVAKELKLKSDKELERLLDEKRQAVWNFRFGVTGAKVRNVKEGQVLRREIARILTILHERTSGVIAGKSK